jgi:transposase, IS5 family
MLRDRYAPQDVLAVVPQGTLSLEPELQELDRLLEDDEIVKRLRADLVRRYPHTASRGRSSTPVEVILRLLIVKRLYHWSYEETERFVSDSLILRQFCRVYWEAVPDDTTLIRWAQLIGPTTLQAINERVVALARTLKVTRGRKLRVDSTVVETHIHHPTDSGLLCDGVRVLSRLLRRAKPLIGGVLAAGKGVFRTRTRSARRVAQQLHRLARGKGAAAVTQVRQAYERLLTIVPQSQRHAQRVSTALQTQSGERAQRLGQLFGQVLPRVARVVSQTTRRVLQGEQVPATEKLVSLFESHTQILHRHKPGKSVEFGCRLWLDEVEGGIISRYLLVPGAGTDHAQFAGSLAGHKARFGRAPWLVAGDRGVSSAENEALAKQEGVKYVVLPHKGKLSAQRRSYERQRWFRRGFRFRAGIEGRISVLRRRFGLRRCLEQGEAGLGRWVGWGIVSANLAKIAQAQAARQAR